MACDCTTTTTLSCCGCCEGITQETPQPIENRPGLSAIAYRVGTYTQFYETLLARIAQSGQPALQQLRSREPDDFTIALLDAFSVMGDVLTFYTERMANESYLRTATQRLSVRQLANLVGYRMSPGVAAGAYLAFTIDPSAGAFGTVLTAGVNASVMPELVPSVIVPTGTQVQSIPGPGQTPQTFETVEQIYARAEWNAMTPLLLQPQTVSASSTVILLSGSASNAKVGDQLLVIPSSGISTTPAPIAVLSVSVSADGSTTQLNLAGWTASQPNNYAPASFVDGLAGLPTPPSQGQLSVLQAAVDIPSAAALLVNPAYWWDAGDVVAAATANQWPLDQLSLIVDQQAAVAATAQGSVWIFRQQAAPFGYNSPNYNSLQPALRFPSVFQEGASSALSPPTPIIIPAAYPPPAWDFDSVSNTGPFTLDQWNGVLYLDSLYPQIAVGSYIMLLASAPAGSTTTPPGPGVFQVTQNVAASVSYFSISGKVSQLTVTAIAGSPLSSFTLRNTTILCQGEALPLAPVPIATPIGTTTPTETITLDAAYLGLLAGQQVIVSGTTISSALSSTGATPATGPAAAEVCTLETVIVCAGNTMITLESLIGSTSALANTYQRSTAAFNANVAQATNGQTVKETLGSGDGTQQFQSFVLHQSPLTYVQSAAVSGSTTTLQVWVDGVLWSEVPYFYGHGPTEHIYITSQDDSGVTTVTFGDGITGSRLTTGTANVTASYRFGIGSAGLVNANQLSQLMSRPLGVRGVNNPLASSGAADPEDLNTGRGNATLAIMTLGRVVSLEDYQDFALAYVGIGKALATWTWDGQKRVVVLTIAGQSGPIASTDSVLTALPLAISQVSEPGVQLFLYPYTPLYFNLTANVQISPNYQQPLVQPAIEAALRTTFGFAARGFGQPVYSSEVIAVIQGIAGVVDVTVSIFPSGDPSEAAAQLAATVPQTGGQDQIAPAQLLTIDPGTLGITVTTVTT
jgi:hypothetical protein